MRYRLMLLLLVVVFAMGRPSEALSAVMRPRLVVNIVVGSMRSADIDRYRENFSTAGFNRLRDEGIECSAAEYSYQGGATPTSLATFSTGTLPSTHGIVGEDWYEGDSIVEASYDDSVKNMPYDLDAGGNSSHRLAAQTLTEALRNELRDSRTVTIALDAASAVMMNGAGGDLLWVDPRTSQWASSTAYMDVMPDWVKKNKLVADPQMWRLSKSQEKYLNRYEWGIAKGIQPELPSGVSKKEAEELQNYDYLAYTPKGNSVVLDMAWEAVQSLEMGDDETTDMLNISLDAARNIVSRYGVESLEAEDMYYRLDSDLVTFIENVRSFVKYRDVIFVVTSCGGSSPATYVERRDKVGDEVEQKAFNTEQFCMILNTFLSSKFNVGKLVIGYANRSVYLDRQAIYQSKLELERVADAVADFATEFRGVSSAVTAMSMRSSYFADGYGAYLQRSFYPRRSGDVVVDLLPGWIDYQPGVRSASGSIYRYDRAVPLLLMGAGVSHARVSRRVDIADVASTLAKLMAIEPPITSDGDYIVEIVDAIVGEKQ